MFQLTIEIVVSKDYLHVIAVLELLCLGTHRQTKIRNFEEKKFDEYYHQSQSSSRCRSLNCLLINKLQR